jgi:diguanylate cyclase (GGDEF)-like protein
MSIDMPVIPGLLRSFAAKTTFILLAFVATGILTMSVVSFAELEKATEDNANIRIDRAARAAAAITAHRFAHTLNVERTKDGRAKRIVLAKGIGSSFLKPGWHFDTLVKEIGATNQGAANFFRWNDSTKAMDRFATTFRKPDGSLPPPMSIRAGHPAYKAISKGLIFKGNVPVMGRLRLACLTPIVTHTGALAGMLAVDVGWVDDLLIARNQLRKKTVISAALILLLVASLGSIIMYSQMEPVRRLARYAHRVATRTAGPPPHLERKDEIGSLAQGLAKVAELQSELEQLAYQDSLTGVGNRARFVRDLPLVVRAGTSGPQSRALIMFDLDRFKEVNDTLGHEAGDAVLCCAARIVEAQLEPGDKLYRIGGDEFGIITAYNGTEKLTRLCETLIERFRSPIAVGQARAHTQLSFGIASFDGDCKNADELYKRADLALAHSKTAGRARYSFFAEQLNEFAQNQQMLASELRHALAMNTLRLHYQPQFSADGRSLYGLEALVRWPKFGSELVPPSEFVPAAENAGLINDLGAWVLNEACRTAAQWLNVNFEFQHVSVNVSPLQLWQPNFVTIVADALERNALPPGRLCLEVTESLFVAHSEQRISDIFRDLRALGVSIALDDFGTGYSSLGYLNKLPLDELKIDRAFVAGVDLDERKQSVLRGIVALGKGLNLRIVAEGVERAEEAAFVREAGCDAIQGFYFARPVSKLRVHNEVERVRRESSILQAGPRLKTAG